MALNRTLGDIRIRFSSTDPLRTIRTIRRIRRIRNPVSGGLSIKTLAAAALAFPDKPRKTRRRGGRRRGSAKPNPRPQSPEPVQGELLTQDQGRSGNQDD